MFRKLYLYFLLLFSALSFAQIGGKSAYQFLNMVTSPRQAALGGKNITIYDQDVNQGIYNPAAINDEMDSHLSLNYGNYYGEVAYGTAAYAYTYDRHLQTFHAGVTYVNYGNFEGRDENGNQTADFTGSDIALSLGYAYNVPSTNLYLGANVKFISSTLESYNSFGGAIDLAAIYKDETNDVNWAFVARNIGTQFSTYAGTKEQLPLELMLGVSQQLSHVPLRWHITLDNLQQWNISFSNPVRAVGSFDGGETPEQISFFNNALRHLVLGAELFPQNKFNLRLGYNFRRGEELKVEELRNFSGLSVGFGLRMKRIKFEYSYSRYTLAANTSLFGLTINFQE